ncbi:LysE family translocator [Amycolatopsis sp. NBC_01480]|uniref:LysE family translocator n=1 Tax=Amycolatopsis sp. NBC_01480 TaxID=2903562 RepID=UPI002E2B920C|nr:LysE family translocator [Amycolatopsis sp. NBC_01480]
MIAWAAFLPSSVLLALVPGANQVLGLRNAASFGAASAFVGVAARFAAFSLLAVLTAAGLGAVLAASAVAFEVLRWCGVAYLLWRGVATFVRAGRRGEETGRASRGPAYGSAARQEFVTALTNPKALLLFASFLPQFTTPSAGPWVLPVLAACYIGVEAVAACAYLGAGVVIRRSKGVFAVSQRRLDQVSGLSFLGFGVYLAFAPRG